MLGTCSVYACRASVQEQRAHTGPGNGKGRGPKSSPSIRVVLRRALTDDGLLCQQLATGKAAEVVVFDVNAGLAVGDILGQQPADDGAHHEAMARVAIGLEEARD